MAGLLVSYPSENVAGSASALVGTPADPDYPAANLADLNPARPAKLTSSSGTFVWDFGIAQRIDWMTLGPHNLTSATFQGNASDSWGSPSLSATLTLPAAFRDRQSKHPWLDLTTESGYTPTGFRYWRLSASTASDPVAIGEVWLAEAKREIANLRITASFTRSRPVVEHRTDYGVSTVYDLGVLLRRIEAEWVHTPAQADLLFDLWHEVSGRALMFPVVLDQAEDEALFVRFAETLTETRPAPGIVSVQSLLLEEVGRGLWL